MNLSKFPDALVKLKMLRVERGLTQKKVAESIGISATSYNTKENGKSPFSQWEVEDLLDFFGVSYREIFSPLTGSDE